MFVTPPEAFGFNWGHDGQSVTFLDLADRARNLYRKRFDGGEPEPVTHFTEGSIVRHEWSPDGKRILLQIRTGLAENLWTVEPDGSDPVRLTDFQTGKIFGGLSLRLAGMKWTPDGGRVVFAYGQSGQDAVLIRNFR